MKELGSGLSESKSQSARETRITDRLSIFVAGSVVLLDQPGERSKKEERRKEVEQKRDRKALLNTKDPPPHDPEPSTHPPLTHGE